MNDKSRDFLSSNFIRRNVVAIVVDEVHKVSWGVSSMSSEPFREVFSRIGEIIALIRHDIPVLALSATVNVDLTSLIIQSCNLSKSLKIISTCSDRKNLRLSVLSIKSKEDR